MVGEYSTLLGGLDSETANINSAASALSSAGNLTIDTLENRRDAMEALVGSFTARADEIDERMRTFAHSIAGTVSDTEHRLVNARRMMEEALQSTVDSVTGQIETLGETAGRQGQQTTAKVAELQQALIAEVQNAFETATERFSETALAMRSTATQVGKELEATRSELQRGVMELPEETRASASAMRRVVAEQIEALNELNAIVRSQPGTHDVSSRRRFANARSPEPETRREPEQAQIAPPAAPAPQPRAERTDRDLADIVRAPARQDVAPEASTRKDPVRDTQATSRAAPQTDQRNETGGGWLRDVLRNASANQQASAAPPPVRGLNLSNLTEDVARSMDDNALAEAWQRYRSGESNVFSRRIYTLTGQGTYDDVRKKLQRDPEFAASAQAYMDEFEQLLSTMASDPRSANKMLDQLVSDRGKVYTMLAHAGGRLA